jgi:hypothetical protein
MLAPCGATPATTVVASAGIGVSVPIGRMSGEITTLQIRRLWMSRRQRGTYIDPAEDATRQSVQFGVASFRIEAPSRLFFPIHSKAKLEALPNCTGEKVKITLSAGHTWPEVSQHRTLAEIRVIMTYVSR